MAFPGCPLEIMAEVVVERYVSIAGDPTFTLFSSLTRFDL